MNIDFFPKPFPESFTLTELRVICKRIEAYCYEEESSPSLSFLKWEQTLSLAKFNKRVIKSGASLIEEVDLLKVKSLNDFDKKRIYFFDIELLENDSISNLILNCNDRMAMDSKKLESSKIYLVIARGPRLVKFIKKISKKSSQLSWVGFDPNLRIQTGMNDYLDLKNIYNFYFALVKL